MFFERWQPVFVLPIIGGLGYSCFLMLLGSELIFKLEPLGILAHQSASERAAKTPQHVQAVIAARASWQTDAAVEAVTLSAEHATASGVDSRNLTDCCDWHSTAALLRIEMAQSLIWNRSRSVVLVGLKAQRDFTVYEWAFRRQRYRVIRSELPLFLLPDRSGLHMRPRNQRRGKNDSEAFLSGSLSSVAAILCHSILSKNCFLADAQGFPGQDLEVQHNVFTTLQRSQKINRVAAIRQVLTTKDGLCNTLQKSGLSPPELWAFSFPCWVLPKDTPILLKLLSARVNEGESSFRPHGGRRLFKMPASTLWAHWIAKPARGSQGLGISLVNTSELIRCLNSGVAAMPVGCDSWYRMPTVLQPYLRDPLLRAGRKWDIRAYLLCTSVLPMRLKLFTEAIVRYASAEYTSNSVASASVLTNTFIGKKVLKRGVAAVTGTLSNLANHFESRFKTTGQGAVRSYAQLVESMRAAVGSLFLSAEASFAQIYSRLYKGHSYRCSNCYHFFGVDLIADVQGGMHVIEVNVSPDLTLSHEGCNTPGGCLGGSNAYDYTKQAAAFNAVQIVYGIESVAESLSTLLRRHSAEITAPRFARLLQPARKGLKREVIEYLLEYLREGRVAGCFVSVYPANAAHTHFQTHLERLREVSRHTDHCMRSGSAGAGRAGRGECAVYDFEARLQLHGLVEMLLSAVVTDSPNNSSNNARYMSLDSEKAAVNLWLPYRTRCEEMLWRVSSLSTSSEDDRLHGEWASRRHVFQTVHELRE